MIRKKKSIAVFLNINYQIVLSWLNCIYLCVFKNSLYHCFCQFLIKYTMCPFPFTSIFLYKQEKVFLKHFICKYTQILLSSFVQVQRCWCSVALLYKHTIPKRLSGWEGGTRIYLTGHVGRWGAVTVTDLSLRPEKASKETSWAVSPELLGVPGPGSLVTPLGLFPGIIRSGCDGALVILEGELLGAGKLT